MLEECRMVLPGVQALFGFQLIAVFNTHFAERLTGLEQRMHLVSLALVAIAGAFVMTPAAYHRQVCPDDVSEALLRRGGRFLVASMVALTFGITLDFYLIARLILGTPPAAIASALALLAIFVACWFALPRVVGESRRKERR
jgi:hypothetical protein